MRALAVWADDYALRALPRLEAELTRLPAVLLRSYLRLPNPATIAQLDYRQIAVVGGADFHQLVSRIEAATATVRVGVVAVLPPGCPDAAMLRGPGVLDVLPAGQAQAAARIAVMADVPIVAPRGARPAPRPVAAQVAVQVAPQGWAPPAPVRELPARAARAVAIASSTGGCWLAAEIIRSLPRGAGPILLAQHMDDEFVRFFAGWIESATGRKTVVAASSVSLEPDTIYIAEGGRDLVVAPGGQHASSAPASSHFVPSANRLFKTFAAAFGSEGTAVVLSGMGEDGAEGLAEVVLRGGHALCQSPESALVPSMPASALTRAKGAIAVAPAELPRAICAPRP